MTRTAEQVIEQVATAHDTAHVTVEVSEPVQRLMHAVGHHALNVKYPRLPVIPGLTGNPPPWWHGSPIKSGMTGEFHHPGRRSGFIKVSLPERMQAMGLAHRGSFMKTYIHPALADQLLEMTIPDKPRNNKQRYRLTPAARKWLAQHPIKP